ncbi:Monoamine oxidase N [Lasiodiplodia hormozganensis]|uniref:Monoamine oxidase N n=1 Tax=Lasiodiplodia hormozganensis TaxID=869390 RepID=A0AA40CGF6_9PEZI|nr:Monoamine oxidase N [Lasiodiplodia hormozganensis]
MTRYGMDRDLILTGDPDKAKGYYTINVPGAVPRKLPHDEAGRMIARAWDIFVNVDGAQCRNVCPLPHAQLGNVVVDRATVERWDRLSCRDRFDEMRHQLSAEEAGLLESLLLHISGGHMETSSLWDMIRSHALLAYSSDNFNDIWLRYKLREGQSELAKRMFDEAVDTGLHYAFSSLVDAIEETPQRSPEGMVRVRTKDGMTYRAARVICTVPLHVLGDVNFTPLLSAKRREAIQLGHVNHMTKIHADVKNRELACWNGMRYPNPLMYGYGDGNLPNGNVHIVAFGKDERDNFVPERDPEKAVDALKKLHDMDVERLVRLPIAP